MSPDGPLRCRGGTGARRAPVRVVVPRRRRRPCPRGAAPAPPGRGLRFGLHLSSFGVPAADLAERLRDVRRPAEAAGVDSLWVMDHLRQIPQLGRPWEDMPEPCDARALAAATSRATVGALVHPVTFRSPPARQGGRHARRAVGRPCRVRARRRAGSRPSTGLRPAVPAARERLDPPRGRAAAAPAALGQGLARRSRATPRRARSDVLPATPAGHVPLLVGGRGRGAPCGWPPGTRTRATCRRAGRRPRALAVLHRHCADVGRFVDAFAELVPRTNRGRRKGSHTLAVDNRGRHRSRPTCRPWTPTTSSGSPSSRRTSSSPPGRPGSPNWSSPLKRFMRGPSVAHPFEVLVNPAKDQPLPVQGTLLQEALIPKWAPKAAVGVLVVGLAGVALWATLLKPQVKSTAKEVAQDTVQDALRKPPARSPLSPPRWPRRRLHRRRRRPRRRPPRCRPPPTSSRAIPSTGGQTTADNRR